MNDQVRLQTSNAQLHCLTVGVLLLLVGVTTLYFSRKVYCFEPEIISEGLVNQNEPLIDHDNESEGLVENQAGACYIPFNTPRDNTQVRIKNSSNDAGDDEFFDTF